MQPLSGPGIGLSLNQNLYPSYLANAPYDFPMNRIALSPGDAMVLPRGTYYVDLGAKGICTLQYLDPTTNSWYGFYSNGGTRLVMSDGFTCRVANMTGCPVTSIVTLGGSAYVQATTTVVASTGGSLWQPIVGGAATTSSIILGGLGFGLSPLVFIPAPPAPVSGVPQGVQATAVANISNTSVSGVTLTNKGAGYVGTTIAAVILPNPFDPNLLNGTAYSVASVWFTIGYTGQLAFAICTNSGAPAAPTLTVGGAGSTATVGAVNLGTLSTASVTNGGAGYGLLQTELSTLGGRPTGTEVITNPNHSLADYRPRKASAALGTASGVASVIGVIFDGGLFAGTPVPLITTGNGAPTSGATIGLTTTTGVADTITIQQTG